MRSRMGSDPVSRKRGPTPLPGNGAGPRSTFQAVNAALALESGEAQLFGALDLVQRLGRVPVTDGHVSLVPQRVIRQPVRLQVQIHIAIGPVEDRMNLEPAIPNLERIQVRAA